MKKTLLIGFIIFCIFQIMVMAIAIDIGSPAINRTNTSSSTYTRFNTDNPANASGTITSVEIWANTELSNCEVATFYLVSGSNFSTRDTEAIGTVTAGSKQTFSGLNLTVVAGDYIGVYFTAGLIERSITGYAGYWYITGDYIPCTDTTFTFVDGDAVSLYGTGATAGITWNAVTISKWNDKTISSWNGM